MTILEMQDKLAEKYNYKPLPLENKWKYRELYFQRLPEPYNEWLESGREGWPIFTQGGVLIARGFSRVVVGDYGAFVEIPKEFMFEQNIMVKPGTEKRASFANAKYLWYMPIGEPEAKLYLQKKTVPYADYRPGFFYVSPYYLDYNPKNPLPSAKEVQAHLEDSKKAWGKNRDVQISMFD